MVMGLEAKEMTSHLFLLLRLCVYQTQRRRMKNEMDQI